MSRNGELVCGAVYVAGDARYCSKLEQPSSKKPGLRYRDWFDKYLGPLNTMKIMGMTSVFMTAGDCWALRCSMLHEGSDNLGEQRARETLSRFRFTSLNAHRLGLNDVLVLNVGEFCEEMCQAVERWAIAAAQSAEVRQRIAEVVKIEEDTFDPLPGARIGQQSGLQGQAEARPSKSKTKS